MGHVSKHNRSKEPEEYPEGHDDVVSKGPCTKCATEYGNVTYADGHTYCFACKASVFLKAPGPGEGGPDAPDDPPRDTGSVPAHALDGAKRGTGGLLDAAAQQEPWAALTTRRITSTTRKKYGYFTAGFKGQQVHVAPYYDQRGDLVAQKVRTPAKDFIVLKASDTTPGLGACRLFGQHVYGDRFDRKVIITEGEIDAMSVAQALDFKVAVVSVNAGAAGAAKSLKANYLWLDRFQEIILWFDADGPGEEATLECAPLFAVGKVRIAKVDGFKDASAVLQADRPGDIIDAIYRATLWRPAGIVNAADQSSDVCAPKEGEVGAWAFHWPWPKVEAFVGPMLPGQVFGHLAGTGIGKSTALAEIEMCLIGQGCKVVHLGFEDTRRDVKLRLMGLHVNDRLDINPRPDAEMVAIHDAVFGTRMVELFDPETAEWDMDAILSYMRYAAKALDVKVLVVDPLSFIAAGLPGEVDERRALDKAAMTIAALAKELQVAVHYAHHLTEPEGNIALEEGAPTSLKLVRSSKGITFFSSVVIGHERNQQATGGASLLTQMRALKNRPRSITGIMQVTRFDVPTGRLLASNEPFPKPGPPKEGRGGGRDAPFPNDY